MISGMTGFGTHQFSRGKIKGIVEIKSLNHRYFDISFYLPTGFGPIEEKVRQIIGKIISRGKVTVAIKVTQKAPSEFQFNADTAKRYINYSKMMNRDLGLKNNISLADLIKLPGAYVLY